MVERRYRLDPAIAWLMRAFAPGCPTMLRSWSAKLERRGERVTLVFDLPSDEARRCAVDLARRAPTLRQIAVGRKAIRDIHASIEEDALNVSALLVRSPSIPTAAAEVRA